MKERFLNVLKWFFIILGVLFLFQMLILSGIFIGFNSIKEPDIKIKPSDMKLKEIQPVVDYAEKYRSENNSYPDKIDIKIKHGTYKYETSNNSNCYKIEHIYKDIKKEYECCTLNSENSNSKSESFSQTTIK